MQTYFSQLSFYLFSEIVLPNLIFKKIWFSLKLYSFWKVLVVRPSVNPDPFASGQKTKQSDICGMTFEIIHWAKKSFVKCVGLAFGFLLALLLCFAFRAAIGFCFKFTFDIALLLPCFALLLVLLCCCWLLLLALLCFAFGMALLLLTVVIAAAFCKTEV